MSCSDNARNLTAVTSAATSVRSAVMTATPVMTRWVRPESSAVDSRSPCMVRVGSPVEGPTRCTSKMTVGTSRSEEHTSELQSLRHLVCRLLLEKEKRKSKSIKADRYIRIIHCDTHLT